MKQFTYEIVDQGALPQSLQEVRDYLDTQGGSSVLVHVYSGIPDRALIDSMVAATQQVLPEARVVGATAGGEIAGGHLAPRSIVVVVSVFASASIQVHHFAPSSGEEEAVGAKIRDIIDATPDIKAAELLVDCADISTAAMFPVINECAEGVKIYGAVPYAHDLSDPMFVITDAADGQPTVVLVTFAGADFRVETDYVIGWKPMGAAMTVTKATGTVLNELDGDPALAVYEKYLEIPNDDHFYENAFEFPFLRHTNGILMMRLPFAGLPDDSIELRAPVDEGDVMQLSYGDAPTIVEEVLEVCRRFEPFSPEYLFLHNCTTRKTFWGPDIDRELEPFDAVAPTDGFLTGGEILRTNGTLVHFNATLVVIGMREGDPDSQALQRAAAAQGTDAPARQMTKVSRMAHFINVAMQELIESNRQLDVQAKTDELTGLLNRREMNRIISHHHDDGKPFCLLMADLDDFKKVNDTYGHDVGDRVLTEVAGLIRASIDGVDSAVAGRWGGEEFMVLLPNMSSIEAQKVAERLRSGIEAHDFQDIERRTISLGVADSVIYRDMKSIYHDVDRALYAAKAAGKNLVVSAGSLPSADGDW